jgi:polyhydroxyalkanoate synthesis regulator protein
MASTQPILIKRYAGRRFYDTAAAGYITLEAIADLAREQHHLIIRDAETGEDITSATLFKIKNGGGI